MINFLIFPNQLYQNIKHIDNSIIYLIEEPRYFTDFKFHKLKLAYHRATMKKYYDYLKKNKFTVHYIEYHNVNDVFYKNLKSATCVDVADFKLEKKLNKLIDLTILDNINFLIKLDELKTIKKTIFKNTYTNAEFYKYMRKKYNILMNGDKPIGGKWSYDQMNRLPLPKNMEVPKIINKPINNKYTQEAIKYVEKNFSSNYGSLEYFIYPIDNLTAKKWLNKFLEERLIYFGKYEDAITTESDFVFHSVLTPMLNIGILTDIEVLKISNDYYKKNNSIPIESYEGFIRQLIGWRNYVYTIYKLEGQSISNSNILEHTNKINNTLYKKLWEGDTGILPMDNTIHKIVKYAYMHHIERLMILGNFMLLLMLNPKDVYKMFMEWSIDSYDWVMVPNVYGMSQYSTDIMMTKPYFSSSKYLLRMSNFKKDNKWETLWDILYYNFINKHYNLLKNNYGTAMQVKHWDNKDNKEQNEIKKLAKNYINKLT
jgi:deoxyribodipyrimidine photolyase-related protein